MPFIGNKPTAVPLSGNDIQDGTITSADLQSGVIQNQSAFKNIIINGDMSIAQRSTSVASITGSGYNTVDRYSLLLDTLGTWTQSQDTTVPTGQGFAKSLKMDCTTADATPAAGDFLVFQSGFEGQNLQYLKKGTANAVPLTLSFWVKSTKTGTFIAEIFDNDNSRQISQAYTISSSNTWEKKTLTFAGDTTGTLDNDNGGSLILNFWLGAGTNFTSGTLQTTWSSSTNANRAVGQVNIADSTSNDWYITGIQLEAGTTASDFEFLPYDVNLLRCQRYYHKYSSSQNTFFAFHQAKTSTDQYWLNLYFEPIMRVAPTVTLNFGSSSVHKPGIRFDTFTITGGPSADAMGYSVGIDPTVDDSATCTTCFGNGGNIEANAEL